MISEFIIPATEAIRRQFPGLLEESLIDEVRIGPFLSCLRLQSGYCGLSGTDSGTNHQMHHRQRYFGPYSPGHFKGLSISGLLETNAAHPLLNPIRIAALNAVSAEVLDKFHEHTLISGKDPVDILQLSEAKKICIVGAFRSYIRRFEGSKHQLNILELDEVAVPEESRHLFVHADDANSVVPYCDILLITGATLLNSTLQGILSMARPGCVKVLVGPTGGFLPGFFFDMGISITGTTRITDCARVMTAVSEWAHGYHLFSNGAEKICIIKKGAEKHIVSEN